MLPLTIRMLRAGAIERNFLLRVSLASRRSERLNLNNDF